MEEKRLTRGAGILLAITSLPSSYGIGTLGDAAFQFVDLLVDLKQRYWQVLPVGPTGYGDSPYQSYSAFAGNPYLIDLDDLVKQGLLREEEIRSFCWGTDENDIDYAVIYENRYQVLWMAFERFSPTEEYKRFEESSRAWLEEYAVYMALKRQFNDREWQSWEASFKNRDPQTSSECRKNLKTEIAFYKFCQFEFFRQWKILKDYANSRGILLIGDVPFYIGADSADVWAHRELFLLDEHGKPDGVAGTPPDLYAEEGQKWGSPLYDWKRMEEDGFLWWEKRIAQQAEMFDVLRLDHFNAIVKAYIVSADAENGRNGKWMKGPGKKLTDVIQNASGNARIIVEDMGTKYSLPGVKKLLNKTKWPNIRILMFAFEEDTANENLPHNYTDSNLVVYAGTHDNDTIVGYFRDKTDYELAYLYEYLNIRYKEEIPDALIRTAYASIADVAIIQMQDLLKLGNEARMNAPSTIGSNWRWRLGRDHLSEERRAWIRTLAAVYRR